MSVKERKALVSSWNDSLVIAEKVCESKLRREKGRCTPQHYGSSLAW